LGHIFNIENFVNGYQLTLTKSNSSLNGLISTLSLQTNGINPASGSIAIFETIKLLPGISGIFLCLILCVIASSSSEFIRRSYFNLFWYSHQILALLFFILFAVHGLQGKKISCISVSFMYY